MTLPGSPGWLFQLDPSAVATNRTMLDINNPSTGIQVAGTSSGTSADFGTAQITEYAAQQSRYGSTVADYVFPNRQVTIPLVLGSNSVNPNTALQSLREKVALFQREGGWFLRQRNGGLAMYADVVNASLQVPDTWGESGPYEVGVQLVLECLPDFYGDEINLDTIAATGVHTSVAKLSGSTATIQGDHPSRCPVIVTDTSGNNQLSLIWGIRSRYYDSATTAQLFYEAEALTPLNGAVVVTGVSGASGGSKVQITGIPGNSWVSMLSTTIAATTGNFTHQGSYRVWARCYSTTGTPSFQLLWGVGSLSVPVTNASTTVPAASGFYLLDLGEVRIDPPPVGTQQWLGAIQVYSAAGGDSASVDCIYLQPLDDGAGQLTYVYEAPASSLSTSTPPTTGVNDNSNSATRSWSNPDNALTLDNTTFAVASTTTGATLTEYLKISGYGFSVPSGATILGIKALVYYAIDASGVPFTMIAHLAKAGTVQTGTPASVSTVPYSPDNPGGYVTTFGGATDLWGGSWLYSDVNNSGFGLAFAFSTGSSSFQELEVDYMGLTVYYALASGFTVASDAVIYANQNVHLRHDGMFREASSGTVYGPVSSVTGDFTRLPPSGMESRPCQLFVKPSRGDLNILPDSGLDSFTVQPQYQPAWIFRP